MRVNSNHLSEGRSAPGKRQLVGQSQADNLTLGSTGMLVYNLDQKIGIFLYIRLITSSNIDQFSSFFHCQNQEKICNPKIAPRPPPPKGPTVYCVGWGVKLYSRRRGSVVRTSVSDRLTFPDMRLIYGWHVTISWVRRPLWVNQTGQLTHSLHHASNVSRHYIVKYQCLKATTENNNF